MNNPIKVTQCAATLSELLIKVRLRKMTPGITKQISDPMVEPVIPKTSSICEIITEIPIVSTIMITVRSRKCKSEMYINEAVLELFSLTRLVLRKIKECRHVRQGNKQSGKLTSTVNTKQS